TILPSWRSFAGNHALHGFTERIEGKIRRYIVLFVTASVARADENRFYAGIARGLHIGGCVANEPRLREVDVQVALRAKNHPGLRFAAVAVDFQFRALAGKAALRVMRAKVNAIEEGVCAAQQRLE